MEKQPRENKRVIGWHLTPRDRVRSAAYEVRSRLRIRRGRRVFVVGHMIDQGSQQRLPDDKAHITSARQSVWLALERLDRKRRITDLVVCSGAAGTDAFGLQWMNATRIQERAVNRLFHPFRTAKMYLPFSRKSFMDYSVRYGEHAYMWADAFNKAAHFGIVYQPHLRNPLTWLSGGWNPSVKEVKAYSGKVNNGFERQSYSDVNNKMLSKLRPRSDDALVALWDGKDATLDPLTGLPKPGGTYDVLYQALRRGIKRENIIVVQGGLINAAVPNLDKLLQ